MMVPLIWVPIQNDQCPYKKGRFVCRDRCAEKEDGIKRHREKRVIYKPKRHTWNYLPYSLRKGPTQPTQSREQHLDFGFPVSRTLRRMNSCCLSHPVCCTLLWQPQQANRTTQVKVTYLSKREPGNIHIPI